ncbi:uncharacterized protein LOC107272071 isoform X2 [Cephus cinctus]|nr:uncharacterized protein LOC107272071 isoform X2 [Cephus cinctus]XP_015604326.1 uncharacterized protein LOC107272071 isoform X2 [Cephus cinctus]
MAYTATAFANEYGISTSANCTSMFIGPSCSCINCSADKCTLCCNSPRIRCCECYMCDSTNCRVTDWELVTVTQLIMSSVLFLGIVITIILFFRVCQRDMQTEQSRSDLLISECGGDNVSINSIQRSILERLRDRPPRYNEIYGAPPLYNSASNRAAMTEAPPVYERSSADDSVASSRIAAQGQTSNVQTPPVAHYI